MNIATTTIRLFSACALCLGWAFAGEEPGIDALLAKVPDKLVCEGYADNNWDLFIMNADGSELSNLTRTPDVHELYPKVSPDGKKIAFLSDVGEGRTKVRSLWVMDIDGKNRRKIVDYARQPFWSPDGKTLCYLPQEYKKFSAASNANKGMMFVDLESSTSRLHPNDKLHHLFCPGFAPNGEWIVATVHGGMGFKHGNLLIKANGPQVLDLKARGCRPCFSPDGQFLAWGLTDHEIRVVPIHWGVSPSLGKPVMKIIDKKNKIYHIDWSPDGKVLALARGKAGEGDLSKPGTVVHASETVGVYAKGWNLFAVSFRADGASVDMNHPPADRVKQLTKDGRSYKEPDWVPGAGA